MKEKNHVFYEGQKVVVSTTHAEIISVIEKITPTGLIRVKGRSCKYKPNGRYYKDYWNNSFILPLTDEKEKEIIAQEMADKLSCTDFSRLPIEKITKLFEVLTMDKK